jgi:DNA replication protein DnaC
VVFTRVIYKRPDGSEIPPDAMCPKCEAAAEREAENARRMEHLAQEAELQREKWALEYGVDGIFQEKTLTEFKVAKQPKAHAAISGWKDKSLILASPGTYGVGKTHLVCALANKLVEEGEAAGVRLDGSIVKRQCPVYVTNEARLMGRIRQTFNRREEHGESDEDVYQSLLRFPLLVIDDVGKVRPHDPSFLQAVYYRVIDDRYIHGKHVIVTTNLSLNELEEHIGGACADRLREMCGAAGIIVMAGESYRRQK